MPYRQALADPAALAARLNAFPGGGLDAAAMTAAVEPGLRRQRGEVAAAPVDQRRAAVD